MKHRLTAALRTCLNWARRHKVIAIGLPVVMVLGVVGIILLSAAVISPYGKFILAPDTAQHERVGLVLGAGVTKDGKPFRELQARLDAAAIALHKGTVDKLILSGDNRFKDYDEPTAMISYLTEVKHIPAAKLQPDYAGRSTYESCERAAKVFGLQRTIIFSSSSHLPRAIYLCRHFGVEAYGISSGVEANNAGRREMEARVKALLNVHIRGEPTILGTPIKL